MPWLHWWELVLHLKSSCTRTRTFPWMVVYRTFLLRGRRLLRIWQNSKRTAGQGKPSDHKTQEQRGGISPLSRVAPKLTT